MTDLPPLRLLHFHPALRKSGSEATSIHRKAGEGTKSMGPSNRRLIAEYFYAGGKWGRRKEGRTEQEEVVRGRGFRLVRKATGGSLPHIELPHKRHRPRAAFRRALEDRLSLITSKVHLIPHSVSRDHRDAALSHKSSPGPLAAPRQMYVGEKYREVKGERKLQISLCLPAEVREETEASRDGKRRQYQSFDVQLEKGNREHSLRYFSPFMPATVSYRYSRRI